MHESRPADPKPFVVVAALLGLLGLFMACSVIDGVWKLATETYASVNVVGRLFFFAVFAGGAALSGWRFTALRKAHEAWKAGGGEERLAAQQAAWAAERNAQAEAQLAELRARGVILLAPYVPRQAATGLERYVDSVVGPQLRQGEIILDRVYGHRGQGSKHFLVCATSQRMFYLETTFLGFTPAEKCLSTEIVEYAELVSVSTNRATLSEMGMGLAKRSGETAGLLIPTMLMNSGMSNQSGFAPQIGAWLTATLAKVQQGASLQAPPVAAPAARRVEVIWGDGSRHPADWVREAEGQALCRFGDGQERWVPRTAVMG